MSEIGLLDGVKLIARLDRHTCGKAQYLRDALKIEAPIQHHIAWVVGINIRLMSGMLLIISHRDRADQIIGRFLHAAKIAQA